MKPLNYKIISFTFICFSFPLAVSMNLLLADHNWV